MSPTTPQNRPVISVIAAARPNFMKVGPVVDALEPMAEVLLVHTGQHYDDDMSANFFRDLGLRTPDVNLGVGSGTHAEQTGHVLIACERLLRECSIDAVVVVGDVNSTLAAALAASKLKIPVAHVEAGLRSHDWTMPEEINRVLTDRMSRWLFTTSKDANVNLEEEGINPSWIHLVGNVMIDTLLRNLERAEVRGRCVRQRLRLERSSYGLLTLHRPSNVDERRSLQTVIDAIGKVAAELPLVFPAHPRTRTRIRDFALTIPPGVRIVPPMGYLDFIGTMKQASIVMTDSGGIQEEASVLGVPCLTLRENTERPVTCSLGTNRLVELKGDAMVYAVGEALREGRRDVSIPLWDGHAGDRIAKVLIGDLREGLSR